MNNADKKIAKIWTDGACQPNPGQGGWCALVEAKSSVELKGNEADTTCNRMELLAAIKGLESLVEPHSVILFSDSQYLVNGMSTWIHNWKRKGWSGVKNVDLWKRLDALAGFHEIKWEWVRGHNGDPQNEKCNTLAQNIIKKA
jgi:ribonuclease HI